MQTQELQAQQDEYWSQKLAGEKTARESAMSAEETRALEEIEEENAAKAEAERARRKIKEEERNRLREEEREREDPHEGKILMEASGTAFVFVFGSYLLF